MSARNRKIDPLREHGKSRTLGVLARVKKTMAEIELELQTNEGIYQFNGGRLSFGEFCRRAGLGETTLYGPMHRYTTFIKVQQWLDGLKPGMVFGAKNVRKAVTKRATSWQEKFSSAARNIDHYHLEETNLREQLRIAQSKIEELEAEIRNLGRRRAARKVTPIDSKKGK